MADTETKDSEPSVRFRIQRPFREQYAVFFRSFSRNLLADQCYTPPMDSLIEAIPTLAPNPAMTNMPTAMEVTRGGVALVRLEKL